MGTYRKRLLHNLSTSVALLRGEMRVDSGDLMTSSCSLIFKNIEECTPRSVENALGQVMIFHHVGDLKVFHRNVMILFCIPFGGLEMVITTLAIDLQMRFRSVS